VRSGRGSRGRHGRRSPLRQATFIIDLALLRSYGRGEKGLNLEQKKLLLDLALWKIKQLLARPFRYRTQCFLGCESVVVETETGVLPEGEPAAAHELPSLLRGISIGDSIKACGFTSDKTTRVYYPAEKLYKVGMDEPESKAKGSEGTDDGDSDGEEE